MTRLVIDASIALAWLLEDEHEPSATDAISSVRHEGGFVPPHWHYETRNGLLVAVRRRRLSREDVTDRLRSLVALPFSTDSDANLEAVLNLAFEHELTFYDALYLELALRLATPLATLDADLQRAAAAQGVDIVGD